MSRSYTVKEASLILGFSTNSIYTFLGNGRLKGNRGNSQKGRFRIPHSSLEKFIGTPLSAEAIDAALSQHTVESTQLKKENDTPIQRVPKIVSHPQDPLPETALSLKIVRGLILTGLTVILIDTLISDDFSLFQQLLRLGLMAILIVLTYQFGGLSHSA